MTRLVISIIEQRSVVTLCSFFPFFFNLKSRVQVTNLISLICLFTPNGNKQESARSPTERE